MKKTIYTYIDFANDVLDICDNFDLEGFDTEAIKNKAEALLNAQVKKAEYSAAHPSKSKPKGASEKTKALAVQIGSVLGSTPMTSAEINKALNTDMNPLQIANAIGYIDGVTSCKVVRETVNAKGLKAQKEYTAYAKA